MNRSNPTEKTIVASILLCAILVLLPGAAFAAESSEDGTRHEIRVITYNVAGLPEVITQGRGFPPLGKRFRYIAHKLKKYDIIGLQEVFVEERRIIEDALGHYYLVHGTDTQGLKKVGSGIYTFSRWSITGSMFRMWRDAVDTDALSHKGFVAATTEISGDLSIDVYNLHMQAGKVNWRVREKQHEQLHSAMKAYSMGQGRPIIIMGDFNCKKEYDGFMVRMSGYGFSHVMPGLDGVDHIFFHPNGSDWSISAGETRKVFTQEVGDGLRISDHEAVETLLIFQKQSP